MIGMMISPAFGLVGSYSRQIQVLDDGIVKTTLGSDSKLIQLEFKIKNISSKQVDIDNYYIYLKDSKNRIFETMSSSEIPDEFGVTWGDCTTFATTPIPSGLTKTISQVCFEIPSGSKSLTLIIASTSRDLIDNQYANYLEYKKLLKDFKQLSGSTTPLDSPPTYVPPSIQVPTASKLFKSNDLNFSIDHPAVWLVNEYSDYVEISDIVTGNTGFYIEYYNDGVYYSDYSDSKKLSEIVKLERDFCDDSTFKNDDQICKNFELAFSQSNQITNDYSVFQIGYSIEKVFLYDDDVTLWVLLTERHIGNEVWVVTSLTHEDVFSEYSTLLAEMHLSLNPFPSPVAPTPTPVAPTPTPTPVAPTPEPVVEQVVTCGTDTELVNGICEVIADEEPETQKSEEEGGGCLIATATYGSEMASEVQQLRELRDNSLLQTESGTSFMTTFNDVYYSFSPIIADYERENPVFKEMVKIAITPMISSLSILNYVDMNSEIEVLGYGISLILLNLGMYLGVPAVVIIGIRKRF